MIIRNIKHIILIILSIIIIPIFSQEANGLPPSNFLDSDSGSIDNPFKISCLLNLLWLSETQEVWGDEEIQFYFIQTADIDASDTFDWNYGEGFRGIGVHYLNVQNPLDANNIAFMGHFDGNNYVISNLHMNPISNANYIKSAGLFLFIKNSSIKNIHLNNVNITGNFMVGSLVALSMNSIFFNCSTSGNIVSNANSTGGVVGFDNSSRFDKVYSKVHIVANNSFTLGGLIGSTSNAFISNSFYYGSLTSESIIGLRGGIVGLANHSVINYVYVTSSKIFYNVFGLAGELGNSTITKCFWDKESTGQNIAFGRLIGGIQRNNYGKNTNELKIKETFINNDWDFRDIWDICHDENDGFPYFKETGTSIDEQIKFLENARLIGNYPNPFNPNTTIKYSLANASNVRIDIFNIKGQKVKELLNSIMPIGNHSVKWNGIDDQGRFVGSGIYFYRMMSDDQIETKRMVLLK